MKRGISLIILLLCTLCLQAQSDLTWIRTKEGRMVAVPKRAVFDLNLPKFTYKSFTPSDRQLIEAKLREFIPDLPVQSAYEQERPMDMIISSAAYQPFFNPYTPMLRRVSPMALDFHEVSVVPISEQVAFITSGQQYTWPGVGGLTRINTELLWTHDRFSLSGGAFGGRYFTPFNPSLFVYCIGYNTHTVFCQLRRVYLSFFYYKIHNYTGKTCKHSTAVRNIRYINIRNFMSISKELSFKLVRHWKE